MQHIIIGVILLNSIIAHARLRSFLTASFVHSPSRIGSNRSVKSSRKLSTGKIFMTNSLKGKLIVSVEDCINIHGVNGGKNVFIDGSWYLNPDRDSRAEYESGPRIEGAKFFDIDDVCSKGELNPKGLPHMMPPKVLFAAVMDALGIQNSSNIVIYGTKGCMLPSRVLYTFRAMGHAADRVHLMEGTLADWQNGGGTIETGATTSIRVAAIAENLANITPTYSAVDARNTVDMDEISSVVGDGGKADAIIIDARSEGRFLGESPEPRVGLRGGHMPNAYNVPVTELLDQNLSRLRSIKDMKAIFDKAGINIQTDKRIICSCGSGVTACILATALEICGRDRDNTLIYDGSWIEWASDPNTPIV